MSPSCAPCVAILSNSCFLLILTTNSNHSSSALPDCCRDSRTRSRERRDKKQCPAAPKRRRFKSLRHLDNNQNRERCCGCGGVRKRCPRTKILSICKDLDTHEYESMRGYSRLAQLSRDAFTYLRCTISKLAIEKIEVEWRR